MEKEQDELLKPPEAALVLRVSKSYLRASDCPKVLLPPNRGKRPLVRYRRSQILAWSEHYSVGVNLRSA